jgi:hypothetical protein
LFELREDDDSPPRHDDLNGAVDPRTAFSRTGSFNGSGVYGAGTRKMRPNVDMASIQSELVYGVRVPDQVLAQS